MNTTPKPLLSVKDGIFLMVGMVIGVGIFKAPAEVAAGSSSVAVFLAVWLVGGIASLCGALVYAELASRHPETGGEYTYLQRAFGPGTGFVFAWARMTVIQTGSIAAVAFVFGDYASEIFSLGEKSTAIYAGLVVIAMTAINIAGTLQSKALQTVMETLLIIGLLALAFCGMAFGSAEKFAAAPPKTPMSLDFAMLFVLFAYGGWNEAAYLAGEVADARRKMLKILVSGILIVTFLYLLVNIGYIAALGLEGIRGSKAVAADVARIVAGNPGVIVLALIVCISALTTINAAIFTGARTNYAFGQDFAFVRRLGNWREEGSTPANALLLQGFLALLLVLIGSFAIDGFKAMVAYTAPVFWTFFLLTGIALFIFRARGGEAPAFRVPLYPVIPAFFCVVCVYMLYHAIDYILNPVIGPKFGAAVLGGLLIMAAGIPLYFLARRK